MAEATMIRTTAAARVTATATCRAAVGALALGLFAAGCGGTSKGTNGGSGGASSAGARPNAAVAGFSWLKPGPVPARWRTVAISSGAMLAYPPTWKVIPGDRGTTTAGLVTRAGRYLGYLNLTPRQGAETVGGWARFRVSHNRAEGDTHVLTLATGPGLRFRTGQGACLRDSYATSAGAHYIEIACLVRGTHATTVIVGAAPPDQWPRQRPVIERAIDAFVT
jgi:hypothetical protein